MPVDGARFLHILHSPQATCSGLALKVDGGTGRRKQKGEFWAVLSGPCSSLSQHCFYHSHIGWLKSIYLHLKICNAFYNQPLC